MQAVSSSRFKSALLKNAQKLPSQPFLSPTGSRGFTRESFPVDHASREKELIVKLLQSMGSQKEVRYYLKHFSETSRNFAVIKIGGGVLDHELDTTASVLTFLQRIGLYPIIVHGAGDQLTAELKATGEQATYIDGLRVTNAKALEIASRVFQNQNLKLVEALERMGTRARPVQGVFEANFLEPEKYGFVGKVTNIHADATSAAIRQGYLPVISSLGMTPSGQLLNINADVAALELAKSVKPLKIIFLNTNAGMVDGNGNLMSQIQLDEDYDRLMAEPWVKYGTRLKIKEFKACLDALSPSTTISVTSPNNLAQELFTHKGAGTLVSKGEKVLCYDATNFDQVDQTRLAELIETAFGRPLVPEYFQDLKKNVHRIYLTNSYRACAILTKPESEGLPPYMDKFAVTEKAQGEGLADTIWKRMTAENPELFWRSRSNNKVNGWYSERSSGQYLPSADSKWKVFWTGINDLTAVRSCIDEALKKPPTLVAHPAPKSEKPASDETLSPSAVHVGNGGGGKRPVGLMGARGYVGNQIIRMLTKHPEIELVCVSSSTQAGKPVKELCPGVETDLSFVNLTPEDAPKVGVDGWFLALPDGTSSEYVRGFGSSPKALVDLSADHRFDASWKYGLVEKNRDLLKGATRIANPGCYATGTQLALLPLLKMGLLNPAAPPHVFGISGYSGAGTKPGPKNDPARLKDNILPYKLTGHTHEKEVSHQMGFPIFFTPHVAPFFQGITLTISAPLRPDISPESVSPAILRAKFAEHYANEPLVKIVGAHDIPEVRDNAQKHHVAIGGFEVDAKARRVILVATLDNLLKGAATQAIQNMNLALGLNELSGIPHA